MYTVFKCFGRSEVREKDFRNLKDAEQYIQEKLLQDIHLKVNAIYRIYEGADKVAEHTQADAIIPSKTEGSDSSSSPQKGSEQIFSPTPLPTSPRPPGMPQNWKTVPKEDKKDDKK